MLRGLILYIFLFFLLQGCGERSSSLKLIAFDLFSDSSKIDFDENYKYIKLQVNSNDFSYLALGYIDSDARGDLIYVWYSSDKHVLRTKYGRLHSISSVSPLWYGQKYLTKPSKNFSNNDSFQRIRFGNKPLDTEVNEIVSTSNNKVPNSFQKFCNLSEQSQWVTEVAVDQFGNKLKSYYGFLKGDNKQIQCVYQELDNENSIRWVYI
jgi:hypothetical protein